MLKNIGGIQEISKLYGLLNLLVVQAEVEGHLGVVEEAKALLFFIQSLDDRVAEYDEKDCELKVIELRRRTARLTDTRRRIWRNSST